jgi:hypothetical protein
MNGRDSLFSFSLSRWPKKIKGTQRLWWRENYFLGEKDQARELFFSLYF